MSIDAFHLPALNDLPLSTRSANAYGAGPVQLRFAELSPDLLEQQIEALLQARGDGLAERPVREIVAAIGRVALRLLDGADPLRAAAIDGTSATTGMSQAMAARVLDGMAADWREEPLTRLLSREFGDPGVLDDFAQLPGRAGHSRAIGPALTFHVFSGNVPGVAVTSLIRSLLVKSASLGKSASAEPVLPALFASALREEDADLGDCVAVAYWPGGTEALESAAIRHAGAVVAYGGKDTIESLRARVPADIRFLGYGHRVSFGMIAREALTPRTAHELADEAALAVGTFDQQGCVSPHLFYVEEGGDLSPEDWAALLAGRMAALEARWPRGRVTVGEAVAIRRARSEAEFASLAGQRHQLFASEEGTAWTVIVDPDPTFAPSCLNRLVRIKPISSLEEALPHTSPVGSILQTVGLAGAEERLAPVAAALARLGASRLTSIGQMAWPPPEWHHDGRPPLRDLVRWCDWE